METGDVTTIGAIFAGILAILKLLGAGGKILIDKLFPPKPDNLSTDDKEWVKEQIGSVMLNARPLPDEEREWLKWLYEIHQHTDEDGVPSWYVPRSLVRAIGKIPEENHAIADLMRELLREIKRITTEQHGR